jgi:2-keto-4-pentenoate hydratase
MTMDASAVEQAARLLAQARRTRQRLDRLPEGCRPATVEDANRVQHALLAQLGERIAGWKVGGIVDGAITYGIVVGSRLWSSGVRVPALDVPLLGMEAEIAFRFLQPAPPRAQPYTRDEVFALVEPVAAIEIVDSRYRDYAGTPPIERNADFMSNGALVLGSRPPRWQDIDLAALTATLAFDGQVVVRRTAGHAAGDPLRPAVDLVNALRAADGVAAGQVMTTGTFTGHSYARPGQRVHAAFEGFGEVGLALD